MKPLKVQVHFIFEHLTVLYKLTVTTQHRFLIWPQTWKRPSFSISATRSWLLKLLTTEFMVVIKHIDAWLHFALVGRYLLQNMSRHSEQVYYDKMVSAISSLQLFSNSKLYWNLFPLMYLYCVNPIMSEQRHTNKVHLVIWSITRKMQRKLQGRSGPSLALTKI